MYGIGLLFIGFNVLLLVVTAMPRDPGTVPRFYWAVMLAAIVIAGCLYWSILKLLQSRLGRVVGFQLQVHDSHDEVPDSLRALMKDAVADGSNRRLVYTGSGPDLSPI